MSGKKFQFSLDSVLALRRHEAERAERDVARALAERRTQEVRLAEAETRLEEMTDETAASGSVDAAALRRSAAHRAEAQRAAEAEASELTRRREAEAEARHALTEKRRPEEALETLKEQEQAAHRKAQDDAEAAFLDEQAVVAYCRNRREAA